MAAITREEVAHLASLARIDLDDSELDRLAGQLGRVLDAVAQVGEVAADDIPPTSHPLPLTNVQRPDEPGPCLTAGAGAEPGPRPRSRAGSTSRASCRRTEP